ncbi:Mrp/NBP35 family ATP-binding protein, partial [bacterium]|nr:Mrp/NBP35 family ATP-binding protein [bacterium]
MATQSPPLLPGVRDVVAVHSAKGGVGKSTTTANLAVTFARLGLRVGVLDADIYGPSVALLFGDARQPMASPNGTQALPLSRHGVKFLSMTNVMTDDAPVIWRGPMVMSALQELLGLVDWGELDLLLIDMPPGTGDVVLTLAQTVPLSGVVTVTTPQEVALADTRRGIHGFRQLQVPILGLVENMSGFVCDACGDVADLFGRGGGEEA